MDIEEPSCLGSQPAKKVIRSKAEWAEHRWNQLGGVQLEAGLNSGAVALLRLTWLVKHAKQGGVLSRRQELPAEAFVSLDELKSATLQQDEGLRIIVLSYGWTTPAHPDPLGATMKRVGEVLALYQKYGTHGVFWDFGSLMQHSPLPDGPRRTPEEQALFIEGLSASSLYYAHSETTVFRLTTWPQGYPDGYELAGANVAQYIDRGWCFSESCWSALTKDFAKSLDLGLYSGTKRRLHGTNGVLAECADSRHPPLLPGEFAKQLARKIFHNPEHDRPLVSKLYKQVFTEQLGKCTELDYHGMGWDDNEVTQLARVLASGAVPNLKTLNLSFNDFTDKGGVMLAKALAQALPELEVLEVKGMQLKKAIDPLRRAFSGRLIK